MKKLLVVLVIFSMLLTFVVNGFAQAEFVIKIAELAAAGEPQVLAFKSFIKNVEEKSGGRIKCEHYVSGQLGNERDALEGLQLGTIEITAVANALAANWVPALNLFELPFIFENRDHWWAVLDSEIAMGFVEDFDAQGLHLLGYFDLGSRHIMTVEKVINSIDDLKGLKIRTMENPAHLDAFKAFGANPTPMAYGELYTSLQTKVIDGAEAANVNYNSKKFYEVAPNWAQVGWMRCTGVVVMGKAFYDKLPSDLQQLVDDEAKAMVKHERELYKEKDEGLLPELEGLTNIITYPDRTPFIEASNAVYDKWADKVGGREKIDAVLNFEY
jgi:tripartite ATP-independent transporter DctP family solute receptor